MFGKRPDGTKIKGLDGVTRMTPLLMPSREGATNFIKVRFEAKPIDDFIAAKRKEGVTYTYRDIATAMIVRIFKMRPRLNRFVVGGQFYQRKHIDVSMMVHKSLRTGEDETAVKTRFTGYETIAEVKQILDAGIHKAVHSINNTDAFTNVMAKLPLWVLKIITCGIRFFDRLGLLSDKFLFETSPMHCSIFLSDLKSIKLDFIYHHLYNFGNCGFFLAMGKEKLEPHVNNNGEVVAEKVLELGISMDERFADGLYYSRMLTAVQRILKNVYVLESPLTESEIQHVKTYNEQKKEKKEKKKVVKKEKNKKLP